MCRRGSLWFVESISKWILLIEITIRINVKYMVCANHTLWMLLMEPHVLTSLLRRGKGKGFHQGYGIPACLTISELPCGKAPSSLWWDHNQTWLIEISSITISLLSRNYCQRLSSKIHVSLFTRTTVCDSAFLHMMEERLIIWPGHSLFHPWKLRKPSNSTRREYELQGG